MTTKPWWERKDSVLFEFPRIRSVAYCRHSLAVDREIAAEQAKNPCRAPGNSVQLPKASMCQ